MRMNASIIATGAQILIIMIFLAMRRILIIKLYKVTHLFILFFILHPALFFLRHRAEYNSYVAIYRRIYARASYTLYACAIANFVRHS